jgi:hypothetical protein
MKYTLEFSKDGPACVVQASAIAQYEAIWAAQYSSRDEAEASLKGQGVIPMDSVLPLLGGSMESLDLESDFTLCRFQGSGSEGVLKHRAGLFAASCLSNV